MVGAGGVEEPLGAGVPLPEVVEGDGLGDELGDGDVLGVGLAEPLGLADGEGLAGGVDVQVGDEDAETEVSGPVPPELVFVPGMLDLGWPPPPLGPPLWNVLLSLAGAVITGSAVIAHEAAATTNSPVAIAAAGRSQPSQPSQPARAARAASGRNLSTTTLSAYLSQTPADSSHRSSDQSRTGTAVRQPGSGTGCLAEILARIRSRPSAAGSTESAASRSAFRSMFSSAV